ncbi:MAG: S9 family peptidase [Cyclobacteriaceae bacterium]|jgi:dipeptidyl-peptidase-4|nr:S9 family peptidase [Cyclobacteriaceae bacterium]
MITRYWLIIFVFFTSVTRAQKNITVDDFTTKNAFASRSVSGINWMQNGQFYTSINNNKIIQYNISTGLPTDTLVDGNAIKPTLQIDDYSFSADEKKILLLTNTEQIYRWSFKADYFVYDIPSKTCKALSTNGKQSYATFSPDGNKIAFVRNNNLFYADRNSNEEVAVTTDGKFNAIINGSTDWVYEEEFSFTTAFGWSADSKKLAYYRFDESTVKEYNMQKWNQGALYPQDYRFKYPKAGEQNAIVEIFVYELPTKKYNKVDIGTEKDQYIPRINWTANPDVLSVRKLNRLQNKLDILHYSVSTQNTKTILTEESKTYIDITDDLTYLADQKHFIHSSEASGYNHIYLYTVEGKLVKQLTSGNFDVTAYYGINEKTKTLYYQSVEASPLQRQLYSISLDGKNKKQLTTGAGTHQVNFSRDFAYYIDYYSSALNPVVVSLFETKKNKLIKVLEKNEGLQKTAAEYGLTAKEFFTFPTVDGTLLNAFMLKPKNFDAAKKYPVVLYQYSGPGSQNVADSWGGSHYYFHQLLAQKGFIVVVVDTRGTGYRGEAFKKLTYKQLGKYELEDHVATAKYLGGLSYVDKDRLAIWGWSYGGYMASLAMTKAGGTFKVGIAVAPVTNWRYYDTVYTERYLQRPQENASGYDDNSPSTHAAKLQGNFLLIHGTGDDNVHFQNSLVLQEALVNAGKQFDSFFYIDKHHGIQGAKTRQHLYTLMANYLLENL